MSKTCPPKDCDSSQGFADAIRSNVPYLCVGDGATQAMFSKEMHVGQSWRPKSYLLLIHFSMVLKHIAHARLLNENKSDIISI